MKKTIAMMIFALTTTPIMIAGLITPSTAASTAAMEATLTDPAPEIGCCPEQPPAITVANPAIDIDLVARCIEAEAGTEDLEGKRLVADVIYNRMDAPEFPDTATGVIMQKGAFSVVPNGSIWTVTPSEESYAAAFMELENRISWEILFFRSGRFHGFGTPWMKWGNHYFSTR